MRGQPFCLVSRVSTAKANIVSSEQGLTLRCTVNKRCGCHFITMVRICLNEIIVRSMSPWYSVRSPRMFQGQFKEVRIPPHSHPQNAYMANLPIMCRAIFVVLFHLIVYSIALTICCVLCPLMKTYYHGEPISVNVSIANASSKTVKKIKITGVWMHVVVFMQFDSIMY